MSQKVLKALEATHRGAIELLETQHGDEIAWIKRDQLLAVATWLKSDPEMLFDAPVMCTAIDRLDWRPIDLTVEQFADPRFQPWTEDKPRFEVVYGLRSSKHRHRLRLKIAVTEADPRLPSLAELWPAFDWQERETFDMYGIRFDGHPDLRRIFMYEEFVGYPLRKDYPKEKRQPLVRRDDLPMNPIKSDKSEHR